MSDRTIAFLWLAEMLVGFGWSLFNAWNARSDYLSARARASFLSRNARIYAGGTILTELSRSVQLFFFMTVGVLASVFPNRFRVWNLTLLLLGGMLMLTNTIVIWQERRLMRRPNGKTTDLLRKGGDT